jgi:hypothetical protein
MTARPGFAVTTTGTVTDAATRETKVRQSMSAISLISHVTARVLSAPPAARGN